MLYISLGEFNNNCITDVKDKVKVTVVALHYLMMYCSMSLDTFGWMKCIWNTM